MVFVDFINHYLGWRNWAVLVYNSVFENMFLFFYIALRSKTYSNSFIVDMFVFFLFSLFSTSYGYLVNDLSDKELDKVHYKENTFQNDSPRKALVIVLGCLFLSFVCGIKFIGNRGFLAIWVVWIILATQYSIKPLRLKERGKTGLILVVIAQRFLPVLLIFFAFSYHEVWDLVLFSVYIFFRGFSSDINHQIKDYYNDLATGTSTCAVKVGIEKIERLFRFSLETEKFLLIPVLLTMSVRLPLPEIFGFSLMSWVCWAYSTVYLVSVFQSWKANSVSQLNPFVTGRKDVFQFLHHAFPTTVLPLTFLAMLIVFNRFYLIVIAVLIVLRRLYDPLVWVKYFSKNSFFGRYSSNEKK